MVVEITATMVKALREKSDAPMMDCKRALEKTKGDIDKAMDYLRQKGLKASAQRTQRATNEGVIASYIHPGSKIGVIVEIVCETDFVARTEDLKNFAKELTMHIAAASPLYLERDDVPSESIEKEKEIFKAQAIEAGKPEKIIEKMVEGRLRNFFAERVLCEQPFVKDEKTTVGKFAKANKITPVRFIHWQLGRSE